MQNTKDSFFSMDRLVEFGMGMAMSQQITQTTNAMMASMRQPPQVQVAAQPLYVQQPHRRFRRVQQLLQRRRFRRVYSRSRYCRRFPKCSIFRVKGERLKVHTAVRKSHGLLLNGK